MTDSTESAASVSLSGFNGYVGDIGTPAEGTAVQPLVGVVTPTDEPTPARVDVLRTAASLITGDREKDYGTPQVNFQRIADLWNVQFRHLLAEGVEFSPSDVALGMAQVKMARIIQSPNKDSFVDAAGYIALGYELNETT